MQEIMPNPPEREPGTVSARMQSAIENQIVSLTESLAGCLAAARDAVPDDPTGAMRAGERMAAVKFAEATASLLQAVARARGGIRFEHHVTREPVARKPKVRLGWNGDPTELLTQAEYDALDTYEKADYDAWTDGLPPVFNVWKKETHKRAATTDELEELREDVRRLARRTPHPPENRGSNGDDERSATSA